MKNLIFIFLFIYLPVNAEVFVCAEGLLERDLQTYRVDGDILIFEDNESLEYKILFNDEEKLVAYLELAGGDKYPKHVGVNLFVLNKNEMKSLNSQNRGYDEFNFGSSNCKIIDKQ